MRYILLLLTIVFSCTSKKDCAVDKVFEQKFSECISYAKSIYDKKEQYDSEALSKSFRVLEVLTRHKSKVKYDDGFYWYEKEEEYLDDLKSWTEWLKINGCNMNLKIAEDTFALHREQLPDYSDPKVQAWLKSKVMEIDRDSVIYYDSISELTWQLNWPDKFDTK